VAFTASATVWAHRTASLWDFNSAHTVSFWFRRNSTLAPGVFVIGNTLFSQEDLVEGATNDVFPVAVGNGFNLGAATTLTASVWYFVSARRTSSTVWELYIGDETNAAVLVGTATHNISSRGAASYAVLGARDTTGSQAQTDASYDSLKVWSVALSAAEIETERLFQNAQRTTNLWAQVPFQADGFDTSGNSRDFTLAGSPSYVTGPSINRSAADEPLENADTELPPRDPRLGYDFYSWDQAPLSANSSLLELSATLVIDDKFAPILADPRLAYDYFSWEQTLAEEGAAPSAADATLASAASTLTAVAAVQATADATPATGAATLAGASAAQASASATDTTDAARLVAAASAPAGASATLATGASTLTAAAAASATASATPATGAATLTATSAAAISGLASLTSGAARLAASASASVGAGGTITTGAATLTASAAGQATASAGGVLTTGAATMDAQASAQAGAQASVATGAARLVAGATGAISGLASLTSAAATLAAGATLAGALEGVAQTGAATLAASAQAVVGAGGALTSGGATLGAQASAGPPLILPLGIVGVLPGRDRVGTMARDRVGVLARDRVGVIDR